MAAALVCPVGRLVSPGSLSKKGTLLDDVSRYIQNPQRRFLCTKSGSRATTSVVAKKSSKASSRGGNVNVADASKESGDITWTSRAGWACVKNCGACCVLDKGPDYPPVEEVLTDPAEASLYRSMVGSDGWCVHYDKRSRSCTIHETRPRFCRRTLSRPCMALRRKIWTRRPVGFARTRYGVCMAAARWSSRRFSES